MKKAISACLAGVKCRYNGSSFLIEEYQQNPADYILICPEVEGGLSTPRKPNEIKGIVTTNSYDDLVLGNINIIDNEGNDYSKEFITGANKVLAILKKEKINEVILKENSPSCGCNIIYDGTFTNKKIAGQGILCALLIKNKIKVNSRE